MGTNPSLKICCLSEIFAVEEDYLSISLGNYNGG
jgi:hypothetical protein